MKYNDNECYERLLWFRDTINTISQLLTEHGGMANSEIGELREVNKKYG